MAKEQCAVCENTFDTEFITNMPNGLKVCKACTDKVELCAPICGRCKNELPPIETNVDPYDGTTYCTLCYANYIKPHIKKCAHCRREYDDVWRVRVKGKDGTPYCKLCYDNYIKGAESLNTTLKKAERKTCPGKVCRCEEDDCNKCPDDRGCATMTEEPDALELDFRNLLLGLLQICSEAGEDPALETELLRVLDGHDYPAVLEIKTFKEVGVLTADCGLVVYLRNGTNFHLTIQHG
jgi:hypothetical protein